MEKNNDFELIHIKELPSEFNREVAIDKDFLKLCQMGFLVVFQYQQNNPTVGVHVNLQYITPDKKVLMREGATLIAKLDGWAEMSHEVSSLRVDRRVHSLIDYGMAFVSGMVYHRASGTVMNNIFVPHFAVKNYIEDVIFEEVKSK